MYNPKKDEIRNIMTKMEENNLSHLNPMIKIMNMGKMKVNLTKKREKIEKEDIFKLFDIFGHLFTQLKISGDAFNLNIWAWRDEILDKIKTTTSEKLIEISLSEFELFSSKIKIREMNKEITKIELVNCDLDENLVAIINTFNKLETIVLNKSGSQKPIPSVKEMRTPNTTLRKLILRNNWNINQWDYIRIIDHMTPNLEILELNDWHSAEWENGIDKIANLKKLKKLTINFRNREAAPLLHKIYENGIEIEEITLIACGLNENFITPLIKIATLKKLCLAETHMDYEQLKEMITNLTQLMEITLNNMNISIRASLKIICENGTGNLSKINLEYLEPSRIYDKDIMGWDNKVRKLGKVIKIGIREETPNFIHFSPETRQRLTNVILKTTISHNTPLEYRKYKFI